MASWPLCRPLCANFRQILYIYRQAEHTVGLIVTLILSQADLTVASSEKQAKRVWSGVVAPAWLILVWLLCRMGAALTH